jgi:hypothetical protein
MGIIFICWRIIFVPNSRTKCSEFLLPVIKKVDNHSLTAKCISPLLLQVVNILKSDACQNVLPYRKHNTYFCSFCWHVLCTISILMSSGWTDVPMCSVYWIYNIAKVTHSACKKHFIKKEVNLCLPYCLHWLALSQWEWKNVGSPALKQHDTVMTQILTLPCSNHCH